MHPLGALVVGAVAGGLFVWMLALSQNRWKIDDVLGVWPLHGLCGTWGGIAAGIFGQQALGGLGGVSFSAQLIGTAMGVAWALTGGVVVYGVLKLTLGLRLSQEDEFQGADLAIHRIGATPDRDVVVDVIRMSDRSPTESEAMRAVQADLVGYQAAPHK